MANQKSKPGRSSGASQGGQRLTLQGALDLALQHHSAGRLPQAESIYQQVLQADPKQPVALNLLGTLAHQVGKNEVAVDLISKSLAVAPDHAGAHNNLGNALLALRRMEEAEVSFRKSLAIKPDHAGAYIGLGAALLAMGRADDAVDSYVKAIAIAPDFAEAHNNLGNALLSLGDKDDAAASYGKAIAIRPDYAVAHYNLGTALQKQGRLDDSVASHTKALVINPDYAEAHHNLGNALKDQGNLDDAIASYRRALAVAPDYADAHYNLGNALRTQGDFDAAVQALQAAVRLAPGKRKFADDLIEMLNYHTPKAATRDAFIGAQEALQQVIPGHLHNEAITDDAVRRLYGQCRDILVSHEVSERSFAFQFFRGGVGDLDCVRHFVVFDTFKAIPEYCFGCIKVTIAPRTVVELLKLMLVFDTLELPNDNTRKCHVEVRPKVTGAYKGVIYCQSYDEAAEIHSFVSAIISARISSDIPVSVKRGCSEFPIAYPEFSHVDQDGAPVMAYPEEWRAHEAYADEHLVRHIYPLEFQSHNHSGFTLRDAVVMRSWLAYAATIGDESYSKISDTVLADVPISERPPFNSTG